MAAELAKATALNGPFHNLHEAYAVILEEVDELWDEVRKRAVFGAGIVRVAAEPKLTAAREVTVKERLPIELQHEVKFRIAKLLARRKRARKL